MKNRQLFQRDPAVSRLLNDVDYPREGRVDIAVTPRSKQPFTLALRIPYWSEKTRVLLNGKSLKGVKAGSYCEINRAWSNGDTVRVDFDFRPHFWVREPVGDSDARRASICRGPLLLAYDPHHQPADPAALPVLNAADLKLRRVKDRRWLQPWLLLETKAADGTRVRLCDFAGAGMAGTAYETWLPISGAPKPVPFDIENPLRSQRGETTRNHKGSNR